MSESIGQSTYFHTLITDGDKFRWQRHTGEWVSPPYDNEEQAYAVHRIYGVPMMTSAEWKEYHPFPHPEPKCAIRIITPEK